MGDNMKYVYIAICVIILLLVGCASEVPPVGEVEEPTEEIEPIVEEPKPEPEVEEPKEEETYYEDEEGIGTELETGGAEEIISEIEKLELSEEEQIKKIFGYTKTKINSYSYKYKGPSGIQYDIYVKENKIRIGSLSDDNKIYIDTEKKTAEEWCISHTKCGRQTGKIADLDYYDAYIETPIDWLPKITESKKIDEGFHYGKQSWVLDTNIGEVIIDSNFGFVYSIKQEDKTYLFSDAKFNVVTDSDVNVPEYLLPG